MIDGAIFSRSEFTRHVITRLRCNEEIVKNWEKEHRGQHTLQVCIGCGEDLRSMWLQLSPASFESFRRMDKVQSAIRGAGWKQQLQAKIASGEPA